MPKPHLRQGRVVPSHAFNRARRFDREFFEAYPHRRFVMRPYIHGEVFEHEPPVACFTHEGHEPNVTVVQQIIPGMRKRRHFYVTALEVRPNTDAEIIAFLAARKVEVRR